MSNVKDGVIIIKKNESRYGYNKEISQNWTAKIDEFKKLSREQAIKLLIKSQKIEQKIETIKKAIEKIFIV